MLLWEQRRPWDQLFSPLLTINHLNIQEVVKHKDFVVDWGFDCILWRHDSKISSVLSRGQSIKVSIPSFVVELWFLFGLFIAVGMGM
jgi:hypothetical protein